MDESGSDTGPYDAAYFLNERARVQPETVGLAPETGGYHE
jgi:hypothetical protein